MNEKRRDFLKRASIAGVAALATPIAFASGIKENTRGQNSKVPKTWLFQGDSITECGRSNNLDWNHVYGQDYAYTIAGRLNFDYPENDYRIFNRGISGNTVNDLTARWQNDAIDINPDLLSILVGINNVNAVVMRDEKVTADDFRTSYDALLAQTKLALPNTKLVMCEPFILPVGMVKKNPIAWKTEIYKYQSVVKELAAKYGAVFVPLQDAFNEALRKAPADHWLWDGVHPMPAGHELIARNWLKAVKKRYNIT